MRRAEDRQLLAIHEIGDTTYLRLSRSNLEKDDEEALDTG